MYDKQGKKSSGSMYLDTSRYFDNTECIVFFFVQGHQNI